MSGASWLDADAEEAEGGAVRSRRKASRAVRKMRSASWVGASSDTLRVRVAEAPGLELQDDGASAMARGLGARRDAFGLAPQDGFELLEGHDVGIEGGFGGDALELAVGIDLAAVLGMGEAMQPQAGIAIAPGQFLGLHRLDLSDMGDAVLGEAGLQGRAGAANEADRLVAQEGDGLRRADDGKAARLVELTRELGEEFVEAEPMER